MKQSPPKLPLTRKERSALRKHHVVLADIHTRRVEELQKMLDCPKDRAERLHALALFQQIPSVGEKGAAQMVDGLGVRTFEEVTSKNGAQWLDELEQRLGVWTDPCVEDQLRCIVHHAGNPGSSRQWFDFTEERKAYREMEGYPANRPTLPWYEEK
ncbi:helix-hairpin-helix domain-containing protein [Salibacterium aidingense]|uniref:helix-hairpin-helix domain-containing protein n=1 Tax=Salibacterium aidingense TaxID=384933 RepID=UPI003BDA8789